MSAFGGNLRVVITAMAVMATPLLIYFIVKRYTKNKNLTVEETDFEPWYIKRKKSSTESSRPLIEIESTLASTAKPEGKEPKVSSGILHEVKEPRDLFMPKPVVKGGLFYCPMDNTLLIADAGVDVPSTGPAYIKQPYLIWKCPNCGWTYIQPSN